MSNFVGSRYDKREDYQVLLSKKDHGELPQNKHYLWMAHWTKASSSAEPQRGKNCNRLEDANKGTTTKDSEALPFEFLKSTVAERLMVGVSRGSASLQHARQFNSNMWGVAHDVGKELGPRINELGDESFERSMKKKTVNLHAVRAVVSETYSVHKLSELPLDFQKIGSSDDMRSDWSHFPMFEINRKIDNILNPKRRSALGRASLNVNMSASHVMALSSQEYWMHSHQIADENTDMSKPAGGMASRLEDPADLRTDPSGPKLKGQLSDTMSCSCSKEDNNSSDYPMDEQHTSHYSANSKHELASNEKKFKFAGNNNNQIVSSVLHNQKLRRSAVHKQQDAAEVMFCAPVLGREFQNEPTTCSNDSKKDDGIFHEMHKSHGKAISSSLLPDEQQHLKTQILESAANLKESDMLTDQIANTLTAKSNGEPMTHGKAKEKYTGPSKQTGSCLFEKLTIPSKSQSVYPKNSVSSGKSGGFGICMYGTNIGSRIFGGQDQSSAKTETLYSDTLIVSKSSAGIAPSSSQKDHGCPSKAKTEQLATPCVRGDSGFNKEDGFHDVNENHDVSSKATIASKQSHVPRTRSTNLDPILFQMSRMKNPNSGGVAQRLVGAEPSDRWLRRLQLDIPGPDVPGSKRPKLGDNPPVGQTNCLVDIALRCNKIDTEMNDHVNADQGLDEGNKLQDNQESSPVPGKSMNSWIGRWCQGGTPVFREEPGQARQATKPDSSGELEGQFPSIAALAMMGRAMNKLRPCQHQRKGPCVVWKTD